VTLYLVLPTTDEILMTTLTSLDLSSKGFNLSFSKKSKLKDFAKKGIMVCIFSKNSKKGLNQFCTIVSKVLSFMDNPVLTRRSVIDKL